MLWFWFTIGFIIALCGSVLFAYGDDITICNLDFDSEVLGTCMMTIGGVLASIMLFGLGINWIATVEGSM